MKHVVFDVGNVLLKWDAKIPYRGHFSTDAEIDAFFDEIGFHAWNLSLDAGKDWDHGVEEIIEKHPDREREIRIFADNWHQTVPHDISGSVEVLKTLMKNGVPTYAITNFSARRWTESQERFPYLKTHFIDAVVSAHEKVTKPDPRIYQILLERNSLDSIDCIFIDDSEKNIASARELGFGTVHFTPETNLVAELGDLGVAV